MRLVLHVRPVGLKFGYIHVPMRMREAGTWV